MFCLGLALVIALWVRQVHGAILISIVATTVVAVVVEAVGDLGRSSADNPTGWSLSVPSLGDGVVGLPSFDTLGEVDLFGAFSSAGTEPHHTGVKTATWSAHSSSSCARARSGSRSCGVR